MKKKLKKPSIRTVNHRDGGMSFYAEGGEFDFVRNQTPNAPTNFEQRMYHTPHIDNEDGSMSSHKMMSWSDENGEHSAPTIVYQNGQLVELTPDEAIDYAYKNGEMKTFNNFQDNFDYGNNGYKTGTPMEMFAPNPEFEPNALYGGRNTYANGGQLPMYVTQGQVVPNSQFVGPVRPSYGPQLYAAPSMSFQNAVQEHLTMYPGKKVLNVQQPSRNQPPVYSGLGPTKRVPISNSDNTRVQTPVRKMTYDQYKAGQDHIKILQQQGKNELARRYAIEKAAREDFSKSLLGKIVPDQIEKYLPTAIGPVPLAFTDNGIKALRESYRSSPNDPFSLFDDINPYHLVTDMSANLYDRAIHPVDKIWKEPFGAALDLADVVGFKGAGKFARRALKEGVEIPLNNLAKNVSKSVQAKMLPKTVGKSSDDLVNLYRVEPENWAQRTHPTYKKDPLLKEHEDLYFPYDSYGKWFESDLERLLNKQTTVAPGSLLDSKLNIFNVKVPRSKLSETLVKNNPEFAKWSKSPDTEHIFDFNRNTTPKIAFENTAEGWKELRNKLNNPNSTFMNPSVQSIFPNRLTQEQIKEMAGFLPRRQFVKNLQKEGLIGDQFKDLNYAARSTDKTNALTKLALDRRSTFYRGVEGSVPANGKGFQEYTGNPYDMSRVAPGNDYSEFANMRIFGKVDFNDPISIARYQASHMPMEQYGYRSGFGARHHGVDALYNDFVPTGYGKYQIKMKLPRDYSSGNYQDWFNKYYKPDNTFGKVATNNGYYSQAKINENVINAPYDMPVSLDYRGTTVVGKPGNKMFDVDETFPFENFKNLTPEQQAAFQQYQENLQRNYNTGWAGQYNMGGGIELSNRMYEEGGEYELTNEEIQNLKNQGYDIELL